MQCVSRLVAGTHALSLQQEKFDAGALTIKANSGTEQKTKEVPQLRLSGSQMPSQYQPATPFHAQPSQTIPSIVGVETDRDSLAMAPQPNPQTQPQ
jgi:hypothetical protein